MQLVSCKSTATVELTSAGADTSATDTSAVDTSATDTSAADTSARFVLRGELPLTTAEVNELIDFVEQETGRDFIRPPVIVA